MDKVKQTRNGASRRPAKTQKAQNFEDHIAERQFSEQSPNAGEIETRDHSLPKIQNIQKEECFRTKNQKISMPKKNQNPIILSLVDKSRKYSSNQRGSSMYFEFPTCRFKTSWAG